jgi:hypothetical protein
MLAKQPAADSQSPFGIDHVVYKQNGTGLDPALNDGKSAIEVSCLLDAVPHFLLLRAFVGSFKARLKW